MIQHHSGIDDALGGPQPAPNPATVLPLVLLVDLSNSMNAEVRGGRTRLDHLLSALSRLCAELAKVREAKRGAELSLVTFGGAGVAHVDLRPAADRQGLVPKFVRLTDTEMPTRLEASGHTPLAQALDFAVKLVRLRNAELRRQSRYRTNVWIITDGENTEPDRGMPVPIPQRTIEAVRRIEDERVALFFTAMLPGADEPAIARVTPEAKFPIDDVEFDRIVKLIVVSSQGTAEEMGPQAIFQRLKDALGS